MSHATTVALTYPLRSFAGLYGFVCDWRIWGDHGPMTEETPVPFPALAMGAPAAHRSGHALALASFLTRSRQGCCLATGLHAPREREVLLWFGAFEGYRAWLNEMPLENRWRERAMRIEQALVPVRLPAGRSVLRVTVAPKVTPAFCVRVTDIDGGPAGDVTVSLPAPAREQSDPPEPGPSPFVWFSERYRETPALTFDTTSIGAWRDWRQALLNRLVELIREPVLPARPPVEVVGSVACEDHERVDLRFAGVLGPVPAYLLLPRRPAGGGALLCLHGHGWGRAEVVGIARPRSQEAHAVRTASFGYGAEAARKGYAVLAPEFAGFGERADPQGTAGQHDRCHASFARGILVGEVLAGIHLAEARAALGVLCARPEVDARRTGVIGFSFGGRMAMLLAAADERVRACVASGALNTFKERLMAGASCGAELIPGLLQSADTPEIFGAIAPRALLLELGIGDSACPEIFATEAYRRIERIYRAAGAEDNLDVHLFRGGHRFNGEGAWPFLERMLEAR
ncbi:MAG: alpha/beta fold hydrolase [Armatimonadetes bacterium]|nr:alpha/beta fold hydrolase [Armatimonadota bacterium]